MPGARSARAIRLLAYYMWWNSAQGYEGNDAIVAEGDRNGLHVCPASALPTALDLVFFRRAATATTL